MYIYIYIYIYIYVYIYIYIYIYICVCVCVCLYTTRYMCVLQFSMHAHLIHVNTTVCVPTLPTGFNADAKDHIQETPVLVGIVIQ